MFLLSIVTTLEAHSVELTSSITTHLGDGKTFHKEEQFSILISQSENVYALVIYENAVSTLVQIFPNAIDAKNQLKEGFYYHLELQNEPLWLSVSEPYGEETIWLLSAKTPFPELSHLLKKAGYYSVFTVSIDQLKNLLNKHFSGLNELMIVSSTNLFTAP